jgi:hypothetical protein
MSEPLPGDSFSVSDASPVAEATTEERLHPYPSIDWNGLEYVEWMKPE